MIVIPIQMYDRQVCVTTDPHEAQLFASTFGNSLELPKSGGVCYIGDQGGMPILIFIASKWAGVVAHECAHAANYIMEQIGHEADYENDEPYTYLLGHLVECIHAHFRISKRPKYEEGWGCFVEHINFEELDENEDTEDS